MASIKIGGKDYTLPELTIRMIRKSRNALMALTSISPDATIEDQLDVMAESGLEVVANWLSRDNPEFKDDPGSRDVPPKEGAQTGAEKIENVMTISELNAIGPAIIQAMNDSGLTSGEVTGGGATTTIPSPLTTSLTESSPSLSPPGVQAETGTP